MRSDEGDEDEMGVDCKHEGGEVDDLYVLYTRALPRFEAAAQGCCGIHEVVI